MNMKYLTNINGLLGNLKYDFPAGIAVAVTHLWLYFRVSADICLPQSGHATLTSSTLASATGLGGGASATGGGVTSGGASAFAFALGARFAFGFATTGASAATRSAVATG